MFRTRSLATVAVALVSGLLLQACNGGNSVSPRISPTQAPISQAQAQVRAVHASPDAGPVDIYVYPQGSTRPTAPTVAAATYPQITNYLNVPAGSYTVDVLAAGAASTTSPVASEQASVNANTQYSIVVGGQVGKKTLQFINFVEPAEVAGQTAVLVHHASPYVQSALNGPVGVGVYDASAAAPASIPQLFSFSLVNPSGPAPSGSVNGGQYFLSPLPAGLPAAVGFAGGPPATGGNFTTLISATPSQLATPLTQQTAGQQQLAADTTSAIPAGAHLSIFAIDTSSAAELVGTLDP